MGSLTDTLENAVLDHILKTSAYSHPATVYLGLSTADPTDTGSGWADPTYTGYARKAITFGAAASRRTTQSGDVTFDPCTAGSSTVSHWGLWTASTGGTLMAYGAFSTPKSIVVGNTPKVLSAEVYVELSAVTGKGVYTAYANSILDFLFRNIDLTPATNIKIALYTTTCSDAAAGTEVTGGSYAQVNCNAWNAASGGATHNTSQVDFPTPTASWGTVVAMAALSDTTNMLYTNDPTDQLVSIDDDVNINAGDFDVTLS